MSGDTSSSSILRVEGLHTWFFTDDRVAPAVDNISFSVDAGKTLCFVGESGCGKSVTALSVMDLIPSPPGRIVAGQVWFQGRDLRTLSRRALRKIRGRDMAMIFQEPMSSLNPVLRVGDQVGEALSLHLNLSASEARARTIELFHHVGMSSPEVRVDAYPHELSGGMKQRVMIAMALACEPKLLIADEPTTALDVTIQAQILELLRSLQRTHQMAMLMITHDLGVVAEIADDVAVMYAGKIVERCSVYDLFDTPKHPYTLGLFASLPSIGGRKGDRLEVIEGMVPSPDQFPTGCRFRTRCPFATAQCADHEPALRDVGIEHWVACHYAEDIAANSKPRTGPNQDPRIVVRTLNADGAPSDAQRTPEENA